MEIINKDLTIEERQFVLHIRNLGLHPIPLPPMAEKALGDGELSSSN